MEDSVTIKQLNLERIRAFMGKEESASKSQIAREVGLSFPTVTRLVDELCSTGELMEQGARSSTGGRCASYYQLNPQYRHYLLVQIEAESVRWNLKDLDEETLEQGCFEFENVPFEQMDGLVADISHRYPSLNAIAIGIGALVEDGRVEDASDHLFFKGIDLKGHFKGVTHLPVVVENDMNLLTMGCWANRLSPPDSLVTLFRSKNGMGGGMMINGQLWTGSTGFCTEPCFLPYVGEYWNEIYDDRLTDDTVELYVRLIQIYAATVNPSVVVLYDHPLEKGVSHREGIPFIEGKLDEIRHRCAAHLPSKAVPSIELSRDYQRDYESGLFAVARKIS